MKTVQHLLIILALVTTLLTALSNYTQGRDYTWQIISLLWILNGYSAFFYIKFLEKKTGER